MKKYYILIIILLLCSCESVFHELDNPYLDIDTYEKKIDIVNGIYSRLVEVHTYNYYALLGRSDDINNFATYQFPTDGGWVSESYPVDYQECIGNVYLNLYKAIININRLLSVVSIEDESTLAGELYFLRSYCYFKLARLFGNPPIVINTEVNYTIERPSYQEVYSLIEEDMLNALDLLPDNYSESRIPGETPHKGTGKAMLAEIYLNMGGFPLYDNSKYAEAADIALEVINQDEYYNYGLLDDFDELWNMDIIHNREYIFGLQSRVFPKSNNRDLMFRHFRPELKFFDDFPDNHRKCNTLVTGIYETNSFETDDTVVNSLRFVPFNPVNNAPEYMFYGKCLKWETPVDGLHILHIDLDYVSESVFKLYLLRYAQLVLTYAEAKARSGGPDDMAFEQVNRVRRRANNHDLNNPSEFDLPAGLSTEQFIDSVVWERAWELAMEPDSRWFDIVRLELKDELEANRYPRDWHTIIPDEYLRDDWYFYKIPQEDRWLNPNFDE